MQKPPDSRKDRTKRIQIVELVGGAVAITILFVIQRLRPHKRDVQVTEPLTVPSERPASPTPDLAAAFAPRNAPVEYTPTFSPWPFVVAAGVALTAFGVVTNVTFAIFGIVVFFIGVIAWAGELIRE